MESMIKSHHAAAAKKPTGRPRSMAMTEDSVMMRQILATHSPDARDVEVKLILRLVDDILNRAMLLDTEKFLENSEEKALEQQPHAMDIVNHVSYAISRISSEITYRVLNGFDAHETTLSIFHMLSHYHWDAKLVLTLAAFALTYGEFWLLVQIHSSNSLAKSLASLRLVPSLSEHMGLLKSKIEALNELIRTMLDVAKSVVEFRELPDTYIADDVPELSKVMAYIPAVAYWMIRSVVACATQVTIITTTGHEPAHSPTESFELNTLSHKLKSIHEQLSEMRHICRQYIEERRSVEALKMLHEIFRTAHIDNMKVLKALIPTKDDTHPLVEGLTKRRVRLEDLRRKNVLLLISDVNISQDELSILEHIYTESKNSFPKSERDHVPFEVVWLPIVDPAIDYNQSPHLQAKFEDRLALMPWYSVQTPKLIQRHVIEFIKERWHFRNRPILVVLDPQGRVASNNAIHMIWIWGIAALPFTSLQEEALWRRESWNLHLLVDGIDPMILEWLTAERYIFLYGGDELEWIQKFTRAARQLSHDTKIPLEMVYVGRRNYSHRDYTRRITSVITAEKLSHCWRDPAMMWFFWTRLESMLYSKIQLNQVDEHDPVTSGIKKILSYDKSGSWAVLSKGADIFVTGHAATLSVIEDKTWIPEIEIKGFERALTERYEVSTGDSGHPCSHIDFHVVAGSGRIPERMKCAECQRNMEKYVSFSCCHDDKPETNDLI